jgi:transcriptional regulator with XRE-family HTH domain
MASDWRVPVVTDSAGLRLRLRHQFGERGMSFGSIRERKLLSQEALAEQSGLSLRTIQRLEAGHRVSYASLRAVAAALQMDVDALEREIFAMKQSSEDFVEVPRWLRRLRGGLSYGAPPMSRRQAQGYEALAIGLGVALLLVSSVVPAGTATVALRLAGVLALVCGYGLSIASRVIENYKAWPEQEATWQTWKPASTWGGRLVMYGAALGLAAVFVVVVVWLTGGQ